jgi:hypothetical protein
MNQRPQTKKMFLTAARRDNLCLLNRRGRCLRAVYAVGYEIYDTAMQHDSAFIFQ